MDFWAIAYRTSLVILGLVVIFVLASVFVPLVRESRDRERKVMALQEEIDAKNAEIIRLRKQQEQFQNDPTFVENLARDEFGKVRPGETIYRFQE